MTTNWFDNFPAELKKVNQWSVRKGKIPHCPHSGKPLKSTQPATWSDYATAEEEYSCSLGGWDGLGFCFSEEDDYIGIDLDNCFADDGHMLPFGVNVLKLFPQAYIEYSPSGKGLHIIVKGSKPGECCKKVVENAAGEKLGEIEIYSHNRYFTMTGNLFDERCTTPGWAKEGLDTLYTKLFGGEEKAAAGKHSGNIAAAGGSKHETYEPRCSTDEIIALIKGSSQREKYELLTQGSLETILKAYGNDHSAAEYALNAIVSWYTGDFGVVDKIFRASSLYTGKWAANPNAVGRRAKVGKWADLGEAEFNKLRQRYVRTGNYYQPECGKSDPGEDFSDDTLTKEQAKGEKDYGRHVELLNDFGESRRDLLSGALHYKDNKGEWKPVFCKNTIGSLRGECQARGKAYKKSKIEDYLYRYESMLRPQLLLDLPEWDGEDRLGMMCSKLKLENVSGEMFEDIFKEWCARMWQRIDAPTKVQNLCLLLLGAQGVGKDVWIASIFHSLGQYFSDLVLDGKFTKESELGIVMAKSLCLFISEFEKTEQLDVGTLKDLITKTTFTSVRKYDRDATTLINRCSVIGACNPTHIFRDVTGNRRFLLFKLMGGVGEAIRWDYPMMDYDFSLNCMAQVKALAAENYRADTKAWDVILKQQADATPDDPNQDIVEDFEAAITAKAASDSFSNNQGVYQLHEIGDILSDIARNHSTPRRTILATLKQAGCQYRTGKARWYGTRAVVANGAQLVQARTKAAEGLEESWI